MAAASSPSLPPHRSLAWPLAAAWACLMVYASLHPFAGWQWPDHLEADWFVLRVPQPHYVTRFDVFSNLLGYVPLGALLAIGARRQGGSSRRALALALLLPAVLSYGLETAQHLLPQRVPSLVDWLLNSAGAVLGALLVILLEALGGFALWQRWRERWWLQGRAGGLALLLLWPVGLLFPPPLPFGLGQVLRRTRDALGELLDGTAWDGWLTPPAAAPATPLAPGVELLGIAAGLLAPCLLAYALTRPGVRRLALLAGGIALGLAVTTLSTALNFGPEHAFAWITPPVWPAVALAAALALALAWLPGRVAAALALLVLSAAVALVNLAPADLFYAASLQGWEQGRFIRFHGLSQWIGWLWPYATLAYLLGRVASRPA